MKKLEKNIKKFPKQNLNKINGIIILDNFWTSDIPKNGLRHFVLVNENNEKENVVFFMVSVLDSEINLKVSYEELMNSGNWKKGWVDLPRNESITGEYFKYKSSSKIEGIDKIFVNEDSPFNIS